MIGYPLNKAISFSSKIKSASALPSMSPRSSAGFRKYAEMQTELEGCVAQHPESADTVKLGSTFYKIRVANDRDSREKAYRLAAEVYQQSGYASAESRAILFMPYDEQPDTLTLLAEDQHGHPVGTLSLVFDTMAELPCDGIFPEEMDRLRQGGHRVVEVTRLAIAPKHQRSKTLLLRLINFIFIYAARVRNFSDFVVEVNPRHAGFYTRLLKFEPLGTVRPCPRVRSAPAVLLRLDLAVYKSEIAARDSLRDSSNQKLLFSKFLPLPQESTVATFLEGQRRPIHAAEISYFKRMTIGEL